MGFLIRIISLGSSTHLLKQLKANTVIVSLTVQQSRPNLAGQWIVTITAGPGPQILVDLFFSLLSGHEGVVLELEDKARFPHCACFISVYHLHLHIVNTS